MQVGSCEDAAREVVGEETEGDRKEEEGANEEIEEKYYCEQRKHQFEIRMSCCLYHDFVFCSIIRLNAGMFCDWKISFELSTNRLIG